MIWVSLLAAASALLINMLALPLILRLAHRRKWYDRPNSRKLHSGLIPRLGGPGIFLSFLVASLLTQVLVNRLGIGGVRVPLQPRLAALYGGFTLLHLVGLYDDFRSLRAVWKLILQLSAAAIVVAGGFLIRTITLPYLGTLPLGPAAYPLTVLWLVAIANAINLIDGMDGLAGGIGAFAAAAMGAIAVLRASPQSAILAFALLGSLAAFLIFNFPPARIFMGDSGSLFLGLVLASLPLVDGIPQASAFGSLIVPITLLTVPILDTVTSILRRLRSRRSIISPDKLHIHHKLLGMGLSEKQILAIMYSLSAYLGLVAVTSVVLPREVNVYLILVVWVGSLLGYWILSYLEGRKRKTQAPAAREASSAQGSKGRRR
jgi:UDP-GlcNAc:undecaprenyl-phosphate GlcNAc-1-phosphate transferase